MDIVGDLESKSEASPLLVGLRSILTIMVENKKAYPYLFDSVGERASQDTTDNLHLQPLWDVVRNLSIQALNQHGILDYPRCSLKYFIDNYATEIEESKFESWIF